MQDVKKYILTSKDQQWIMQGQIHVEASVSSTVLLELLGEWCTQRGHKISKNMIRNSITFFLLRHSRSSELLKTSKDLCPPDTSPPPNAYVNYLVVASALRTDQPRLVNQGSSLIAQCCLCFTHKWIKRWRGRQWDRRQIGKCDKTIHHQVLAKTEEPRNRHQQTQECNFLWTRTVR